MAANKPSNLVSWHWACRMGFVMWPTRLPLGNSASPRRVASRQGETPMQIRGFKLLLGIVVLMFVAAGVAHAGTKDFKASFSGTTVAVPIDLDGNSCFTAVNGATVCTDTSGYANYSGRLSPGGGFTGQNIGEYVFVPGSGSCNIFGTSYPGLTSCTLAGSSETGCEFQLVGGRSGSNPE